MNSNLRVMAIFGTRPEAIKLSPVVKAMQADKDIDPITLVTAQHREMLNQALDLFHIQPDFDLDIMEKDQSLAQVTARIFTDLDPILARVKPDWVIVQGDTTTVMAAALNAFYHKIKIGHVEAGLRTHDKWQPFPEEINRRIAGVTADLHFAPTSWARDNLLAEGIPEASIKITGNTIIDALNQVTDLPVPPKMAALLQKHGIISGKKRLVVVTAHRRENHGQPIKDICTAIAALAHDFQDNVHIVYPVHLNPHIQQPVHAALEGVSNISLLPPLDYLSLAHLLKNAFLILTDSGGIQEEATGLGVPCLVLREVTERPEGIQAGILTLVGTHTEKIITTARNLLTDQTAYQAMAAGRNVYGDGKASWRILEHLCSFSS